MRCSIATPDQSCIAPSTEQGTHILACSENSLSCWIDVGFVLEIFNPLWSSEMVLKPKNKVAELLNVSREYAAPLVQS